MEIDLLMLSFVILQILFLCSLTTPLTPPLHECSTSGNYTLTNPFKTNLDKLLSALPEINDTWFLQETVGKAPYQVYGLAMCYYETPDTQSCTNCLQTAVKNIKLNCPYSSTAILWDDNCFIRYTNESVFFIPSNVIHFVTNPQYALDPKKFMRMVGDLLNELTDDAASSTERVAAGKANYTTFDNNIIYMLVQCTEDLSSVDCEKCVKTYARNISSTCGAALGCRVFGESCYIRYENSSFYRPISPPSPKGPKSPPVVIVVSVILVVFVMLVIVGIFFWRRSSSKTHRNGGDESVLVLPENVERDSDDISNSKAEYQVFKLVTLRDATDNYSEMNKIGKGGFGPVYKGILPDGQEIAVKILSEGSRQGTEEFRNEIDLLAKLKHKNLVQLVGCCVQENQTMLCYEYLSNGSLDKILFEDQYISAPLGWTMRFKIIKGISDGLHYLHDESSLLKIIHRDLKASNILLDKDMNPKISDFGLARLFEEDQTHKDTSVIVGTFGYMPMEYFLHGHISAKSDVYSFGILVLEIVTGRKNSSFHGSLIDHALQHFNNGTISQLKDPILEDEYLDEIKRCVYIALLCIQGDPIDRPNMENVQNMLRGNSISDVPSNLPRSKFVGFNFQ